MSRVSLHIDDEANTAQLYIDGQLISEVTKCSGMHETVAAFNKQMELAATSYRLKSLSLIDVMNERAVRRGEEPLVLS